jgi:hypothetical protein
MSAKRPAASGDPRAAPATPPRGGGGKRPARLAGASFAVGVRRTTDAAIPRLMMAIPKKLVPSSPVRNLLRRVIRESYRAALVRHPQALSGLSLRVQLVRLPLDPAAPATGPGGRALRPFARRPTDRALKRVVRAEIDGLLARLAPRPAS